jgi:MFS family permease
VSALAPRLLLVVFCPFAAGYFLSFFFRNVNAVISKDLAREFALSPAELGLLTSDLPACVRGIPAAARRAARSLRAASRAGGLYSVAGAGALVFGFAQDFTTLSIGRALIGLGVSGGLMGAIKAFTLWFPLSRLATLNGLYLAIGGLGGLSATAPVEALLGPLGWRALFYCAAALSAIAATVIFTVVPERPLAGTRRDFGAQVLRFREVFASLDFWRICLPLVICHCDVPGDAGLWLAPWLYDVAGAGRGASPTTCLRPRSRMRSGPWPSGRPAIASRSSASPG